MSDFNESETEESEEESKPKNTQRFKEDGDEEKKSTEDQDELDHLRRLIKDVEEVEEEDAECSESGDNSDSEEEMFTSRALQEAKEISGGDFDFSEFDSDAYDQGKDEDQGEEVRDRPKKQTKNKSGRKRIFETNKPSELESSHMSRNFTRKELRLKIVELFQKNVPQRKIAKTLNIPPSTVHNIIKRFRETGEISVRKGQGRKSILDAGDLQALKQHCIENKPNTVLEITAWAQKKFKKSLSVNTVRRAMEKCKLNIYYARKKSSLDQSSFKMDKDKKKTKCKTEREIQDHIPATKV